MESPRKRKRLRGGSPALGWMCFEKLIGDHLNGMSMDDMDFEKMRKVYKLARFRKGQKIRQLVREYKETYFRELILNSSARGSMSSDDGSRRRRQAFQGAVSPAGSARRSLIKYLLTHFKN